MKTILIIEDTRNLRLIMREALELRGYKVKTASNGKEGLDLLSSVEKPGLIFLDIMMPIMDGYQFLEILKSDENLADIPVVVVSAAANADEIKGANAFLPKPFKLSAFLEAAKKYCKN